jgi:hypothetical protein
MTCILCVCVCVVFFVCLFVTKECACNLQAGSLCRTYVQEIRKFNVPFLIVVYESAQREESCLQKVSFVSRAVKLTVSDCFRLEKTRMLVLFRLQNLFSCVLGRLEFNTTYSRVHFSWSFRLLYSFFYDVLYMYPNTTNIENAHRLRNN